MTIGAPMALVTVPTESSVGANMVRAIRSQIMQNTDPQRKVAGIITSGFCVFSMMRQMCGTAIPMKEIGPANAVTQAERILEKIISRIRNSRMFTPRLCAYPSPSA